MANGNAEQEARPQVTQLVQPIPGILIGIGGTGGEILLRIRKKFYDMSTTFGLDEWPIVQYLYLDTDLADRDLKDENQKYYKFNTNDSYPATLPNWRTYTEHLQNYPTLKKWWYEDQADLKSTGLNAGAGQIRGYSRLAVWAHAAGIKERIASLINQARDPAATSAMAQRGITVDNQRVWVYVVGSLAGGTGSGAFLDMGYLLRDLGIGGVETMAFLVMPSAFDYLSIPKERLRANAYAALMELEYFNLVKEKRGAFDDKWLNGRPTKTSRESPYTRVFLVDGRNMMEQTVSGRAAREGLFDLIAQQIFMDYAISGFGTEKRSAYVDMDQYLAKYYVATHRDQKDKVLYREVFSRAYQTLGLSRIYIPLDRIKKSASYYLWADACTRLAGTVTRDDSKAVSDQIVRSGRLRLMYDPAGHVNHFQDSLLAGPDDKPGETISSIIESAVDTMERKALQGDQKNVPRSEYLREQSDTLERLYFIQPSTKPETYREWGMVYRQMEINRQRYLADLKEALESVAMEYAESSVRGVGFARDIMADLMGMLIGEREGCVRRWREELAELEPEVRAYRKMFNDRILGLSEHEHWSFLDAPLLKATTIKYDIKWSSLALRKTLLGAARQRFLENAIQIAEDCATAANAIIEHLAKVQATLVELSKFLKESGDEFSREKVSPIDECPYDTKDVREWYMPKAYWDRWSATEVELSNESLERAGRYLGKITYSWAQKSAEVLSIYHLPQAVERLTKERVGRILARTVYKEFDGLNAVNVISVMSMKWPDESVRAAAISGVIKKSMPWLARNGSFPEEKEERNIRFVSSYKMGEGPEFGEFASKVQNALDASWPQLNHSPSPIGHTIVFFTQKAGFPLCYASCIPELSHSYRESVRDDKDRLHITKEEWKFSWIEQLSEEELRRIRAATEIFLVGLALGVVRPVQRTLAGGSKRYTYQFEALEYGLKVPKDLGSRRGAILRLIQDQDEAAEIRSQSDDRLEKLTQRDELDRAAAVIRSYFHPRLGPYARREVAMDEKNAAPVEVIPLECSVLEEYFDRKFKDIAGNSLEVLVDNLRQFAVDHEDLEIPPDAPEDERKRRHRALSPEYCQQMGLNLGDKLVDGR